MITTTQMYWIAILDNITVMTTILTVVFLLGSIAAFCYACAKEDHGWLPILSLIALLATLAISAFTPSTKQMAAILVIPKIANGEKVQTVGNKIYELAVEWMDELRPRR